MFEIGPKILSFNLFKLHLFFKAIFDFFINVKHLST